MGESGWIKMPNALNSFLTLPDRCADIWVCTQDNQVELVTGGEVIRDIRRSWIDRKYKYWCMAHIPSPPYNLLIKT